MRIFLTVLRVLIVQGLLCGSIQPAFAQNEAASHLTDRLNARGYFSSKGARLYYEIYGNGEPLILLHGLLGDTSWWGRDKYISMSELLLTKYQLIALDMRGHGKSDKPHEQSAYGAVMAEDVIALLDHLQIKKPRVFAYSFGVLIASRLLETAQDRLESVVLGGGLWARKGVDEDYSWALDLANQFETGQGLRPLLRVLTAESQNPNLKNLEATYLAGNDLTAIAALLRSTPELGIDAKPEPSFDCTAD